jgi:GTP1/Obg family GTP-binding protein
LESLLQYYKEDKYAYNFQSHSKQHYFSSTVADVLIAEGATERLMQYIEKYLSAENVEKYYSFFVDLYPEKTLELFQKAVDDSAKNLGRSNYEYIARLLKKMREIKNEDVIVREMLSRYRIEYKKCTAMMEILKNL